jgi:hypothetical protein
MKMASELSKRIAEMPPLPPEEKARRTRAAKRWKELLSGDPFYAGRSDKFWRTFQSSRVLVNP